MQPALAFAIGNWEYKKLIERNMKEINAQGRRNMKGMNAIEGTYITGNDRKEERKR